MRRVFLYVQGTFLVAEVQGIFARDKAPGGKNLTAPKLFTEDKSTPPLIMPATQAEKTA